MSLDAARARVRRLVAGAGRIAARDDFGMLARQRLARSTGLPLENVDACLCHCLETAPSPDELDLLCKGAAEVPAAHVLLSATVFVGALRALALAAASTNKVSVRPSRREPEMVALLEEALALDGESARDPMPFRVVATLHPTAGDLVHAYGTEKTLAEVRKSCPAGVLFHGHGPGFGIAVLELSDSTPHASFEENARRLAWDTVLFDQRGCLSPRLVFVRGPTAVAESFAEALAVELGVLERTLPEGVLEPHERARRTRYLDAMTYAGAVFRAGSSGVSFTPSATVFELPPAGRVLHVGSGDDLAAFVGPFGDAVTAVGLAGSPELRAELRALLPRARLSALGAMQSPPLDGPVDRRSTPVLV